MGREKRREREMKEEEREFFLFGFGVFSFLSFSRFFFLETEEARPCAFPLPILFFFSTNKKNHDHYHHHPYSGKRQRTYTQMVLTCFGRKGEVAIGIIQLANLALTAIAYMVTAAKTMRTLAHAGCGLSPAEAAEVGNVTNCFDTYWIFVLLFGALQLFLSQVPSLENLAAASVIGAVASFGYALIAFVLSCFHAPRPPLGSVLGQPVSVWKDLNAVGNILFAFSFSFMLIEIQDTMKGDGERGPVRPMKRAVNIALAIMGSFYLAVALSGEMEEEVSGFLCFFSTRLSPSLNSQNPNSSSSSSGYAAFGDTAKNRLGILMPDDILTGFPGPRWAIFLANILVLVHMIPAFQVWSQPLFECVELAVEHRVAKKRDGKWPLGLSERRFRIIFRTIYVILCTFLALMLPFMGVILGLAGALGFWPATVREIRKRVFLKEREKKSLKETKKNSPSSSSSPPTTTKKTGRLPH